jgi:MoaA/NifB/PqqE/SkfB family radical SAM enzyme
MVQSKEADINSIYFEGGEPFLYYAVLVKAVRRAADMGFSVGIVSNAYWASLVPDAGEWLLPFTGRLVDLTISSDMFHCGECLGECAQNAIVAAKWLKIPTGMISIDQPEIKTDTPVMYRGRAAKKLVSRAATYPWGEFCSYPHEDLREPGRVHLDPLGNLLICQGVSSGNVFETPLKVICENYNAGDHPICGPLLAGGPVELVSVYNVPHDAHYADACHLCYEACIALRDRFPEHLKPDQMYGVLK